MLKALLIFTLCASSVCAQSVGPENFTARMINGRGWSMMTNGDKVMYLVGIKDILFALQSSDELTAENATVFSVAGFSAAETAKSIDLFYAVPENLRIPVIFALSVSSAKFKGATQGQLDKMTTHFRSVAAQ